MLLSLSGLTSLFKEVWVFKDPKLNFKIDKWLKNRCNFLLTVGSFLLTIELLWNVHQAADFSGKLLNFVSFPLAWFFPAQLEIPPAIYRSASRGVPESFGSEKKHAKKKTRKQKFHGIVPGFLGEFCFFNVCVCFFLSPIRNDPKNTLKHIFAPTQSRDNPANLFMFMCVFLSA